MTRERLAMLLVSTATEMMVLAREIAQTAAPADGEIPTMDQIKKHWIDKALAASGGNRQKAANMLGIGVRTVFRHLGEKQ
jgi:DNA-binding NtrC family response regulator